MVAVGRSNPTGGNFLVNLFFQIFLSRRSSVRFAYGEKPDCLLSIVFLPLHNICVSAVQDLYLFHFQRIVGLCQQKQAYLE